MNDVSPKRNANNHGTTPPQKKTAALSRAAVSGVRS